MNQDEILDQAVDAGWTYVGSFTGSVRAAVNKALQLYKESAVLAAEQRNQLLQDRVLELERVLYQISRAVGCGHDAKLSTSELPLILAEVRRHEAARELVNQLHQQDKALRAKAAAAMGEALTLMRNKEHLRKRFHRDAHWIRFLRDLRLLLQKGLE